MARGGGDTLKEAADQGSTHRGSHYGTDVSRFWRAGWAWGLLPHCNKVVPGVDSNAEPLQSLQIAPQDLKAPPTMRKVHQSVAISESVIVTIWKSCHTLSVASVVYSMGGPCKVPLYPGHVLHHLPRGSTHALRVSTAPPSEE